MPQKHIHIFKAGQHTAMQGESLAFSESDLAACAAAYNPQLHEAPLVVGHPTADAPAYGWVQGLNATAEGLFAAPQQVEPAFAEAVKEGRFKKVSASFYRPDSPANPTPGVYYLRHVGFLGAQPPAVKGLKSVNFADSDADCITVEFNEQAPQQGIVARYTSALRELLSLGSADTAKLNASPAFQEPKPKEQPMPDTIPTPAAAPLPDGGAGTPVDPARVAQLEAQVANFQEVQRRHTAQSLLTTVMAEGRLSPAQGTGLVEFMASLSEADDAVCFGEGETAAKVSQHSFMAAFLAKLPQQIDFTEAAADSHHVDGLSVQDAAHAALCYQENLRQKGIVISVTDAVAAVKAGKYTEAPHG